MNLNIFNKLFSFVIAICDKHNIDESHGLSHSMDVLNFAHDIYNSELYIYPPLKEHENIIYISAILHDMCDKKYMNETEGLLEIDKFLDNKLENTEKKAVLDIISTMSYSTVKKNGFPSLGIYQKAYHCVREADLLAAYDFDRCIIYDMYKRGNSYSHSFSRAEELFNNRVLKYGSDNLFTTEHAKQTYPVLHNNAVTRIQNWRRIVKRTII